MARWSRTRSPWAGVGLVSSPPIHRRIALTRSAIVTICASGFLYELVQHPVQGKSSGTTLLRRYVEITLCSGLVDLLNLSLELTREPTTLESRLPRRRRNVGASEDERRRLIDFSMRHNAPGAR